MLYEFDEYYCRRGKKGALKAVGKEEMDPTLLKEYIFYKLEDKVGRHFNRNWTVWD